MAGNRRFCVMQRNSAVAREISGKHRGVSLDHRGPGERIGATYAPPFTIRKQKMGTSLLTGVFCSALLAMTAAGRDISDWKQELAERIPLYGHRNWIVVADSAYPAQARG